MKHLNDAQFDVMLMLIYITSNIIFVRVHGSSRECDAPRVFSCLLPMARPAKQCFAPILVPSPISH